MDMIRKNLVRVKDNIRNKADNTIHLARKWVIIFLILFSIVILLECIILYKTIKRRI